MLVKSMQLELPLTLVVTIDVTAPIPKSASQQFLHVLEEWKDQKWKISLIVKSVQTSLWGKCKLIQNYFSLPKLFLTPAELMQTD